MPLSSSKNLSIQIKAIVFAIKVLSNGHYHVTYVTSLRSDKISTSSRNQKDRSERNSVYLTQWTNRSEANSAIKEL
jgi:hypothetical protein